MSKTMTGGAMTIGERIKHYAVELQQALSEFGPAGSAPWQMTIRGDSAAYTMKPVPNNLRLDNKGNKQ